MGFVTSCFVTYGDRTSSNITRLTQDTCKLPAKHVLLFFDGEPIDFKYDKIGLVEAEGAENVSNEKVLDYLKYEAWKNCADAIIKVKPGYKDREQGTLFDKDSERVYASKVFSGLAVRIQRDSTYKEHIDTAFVSRVRKDDEQANKKTSNQTGFSFLSAIICIVVVIVVVATK
jgi:hypothetical protein